MRERVECAPHGGQLAGERGHRGALAPALHLGLVRARSFGLRHAPHAPGHARRSEVEPLQGLDHGGQLPFARGIFGDLVGEAAPRVGVLRELPVQVQHGLVDATDLRLGEPVDQRELRRDVLADPFDLRPGRMPRARTALHRATRSRGRRSRFAPPARRRRSVRFRVTRVVARPHADVGAPGAERVTDVLVALLGEVLGDLRAEREADEVEGSRSCRCRGRR